ncbi:MAG: hypothetical protein CL920_12245 [Deltaproteobacteria bacterium]|nr:hypothetical protein [Deltaproteobacteria bacterium]
MSKLTPRITILLVLLLTVVSCGAPQFRMQLYYPPDEPELETTIQSFSVHVGGEGIKEDKHGSFSDRNTPFRLEQLKCSETQKAQEWAFTITGLKDSVPYAMGKQYLEGVCQQQAGLKVFVSRTDAFSTLGLPTADGTSKAASLPKGLIGHQTLRLQDGRVLILGGLQISRSFESPLNTSSLFGLRQFPKDSQLSKGTWIYDPASGTLEAGPTLRIPRAFFTATERADGSVWLIGGITQTDDNALDIVKDTELLTPVQGHITAQSPSTKGPPLQAGRAFHTLTPIRSSQGQQTTYVVYGGLSSTEPLLAPHLESFEYNSKETNAEWTVTELPQAHQRLLHTANYLPLTGQADEAPQGYLVITGGIGPFNDGQGIRYKTHGSVLRLTRQNGEWIVPEATEALSKERAGHTVTQLPDGRFVVIGGFVGKIAADLGDALRPEKTQASLEWLSNRARTKYTFTNESGDTKQELTLPAAVLHTTTLLHDGRLLISGGVQADEKGINTNKTGFVLTPNARGIRLSEKRPPLKYPRHFHTTVQLRNHSLLLLGGIQTQTDGQLTHQPQQTIESYYPATAPDAGIDKWKSCYSGDAKTRHIGECRDGTSGTEGEQCLNEIVPTPEECNGKDDDCDGLIDNADKCKCDQGVQQLCGKSEGECLQGTQQCVNGTWGPCEGERKPSPELCDGKDNDCDGQIDNGMQGLPLQQECYPQSTGCTKVEGDTTTYKCEGVCRAGTQSCTAGKWGACNNPILPKDEVCDGADNDCDGKSDNNADGTLLTKSCYTGQDANTKGVGTCKAGTQTCTNGEWQGVCVGEVTPNTQEACDGKDDNCDGQIDETCQCKPGKTQKCFTGPSSQCSGGMCQGLCKYGEQLCDTDGNWGKCKDAVVGTTETCDGEDNDCDGQVDNAIPKVGTDCTIKKFNGMTIQGACTKGSFVCIQGNLECEPGTPKEETCNNEDDDCDGQIDNQKSTQDALVRPCISADNAGCKPDGKGGYTCTGACKAATQTCNKGTWSTCKDTKPTLERCHLDASKQPIDDDCDGHIDEVCYTATVYKDKENDMFDIAVHPTGNYFPMIAYDGRMNYADKTKNFGYRFSHTFNRVPGLDISPTKIPVQKKVGSHNITTPQYLFVTSEQEKRLLRKDRIQLRFYLASSSIFTGSTVETYSFTNASVPADVKFAKDRLFVLVRDQKKLYQVRFGTFGKDKLSNTSISLSTGTVSCQPLRLAVHEGKKLIAVSCNPLAIYGSRDVFERRPIPTPGNVRKASQHDRIMLLSYKNNTLKVLHSVPLSLPNQTVNAPLDLTFTDAVDPTTNTKKTYLLVTHLGKDDSTRIEPGITFLELDGNNVPKILKTIPSRLSNSTSLVRPIGVRVTPGADPLVLVSSQTYAPNGLQLQNGIVVTFYLSELLQGNSASALQSFPYNKPANFLEQSPTGHIFAVPFVEPGKLFSTTNITVFQRTRKTSVLPVTP